jgi:hypothetical protein
MRGERVAGKGKSEVDPAELDRAARKMREMAVRDFHAADDFQRGLTERAGADYVFGRSPAAQEIAAKWDRAVARRAQGAEDLGTRTQDMAEDLERTADEYRRNDDEQADTLGGVERRLSTSSGG